MKINYFDLGIYHGEEIEMFLDTINSLNIDYNVYGFEAHPKYISIANSKFKSNTNVSLYNYLISDTNGIGKLYLERGGTGHGNSMYATKYNVGETFIEVESISLVDWIIQNVPDYKTSYNIIRFNIEGAELPLIRDIVNKNFTRTFNLYLGADVGSDIKKVHEIRHEYNDYLALLQTHHINILPFCKELPYSINLANVLKQNLL
jgi:FkbM family methyltransferase